MVKTDHFLRALRKYPVRYKLGCRDFGTYIRTDKFTAVRPHTTDPALEESKGASYGPPGGAAHHYTHLLGTN